MKRNIFGIYEILLKGKKRYQTNVHVDKEEHLIRQDRGILRKISTQKKPVREISRTSTFRDLVSVTYKQAKFINIRRKCRTPMTKMHHRNTHIL